MNSVEKGGGGSPAALRARNRARVLAILRSGSNRCQPDRIIGRNWSLAARIGTLLGTLDPVLAPARPAAGSETQAEAKRGRPGTLYAIDPAAAWAAAIDIGRNHIFASVCNLRGAVGPEIAKEEAANLEFSISRSPHLTLERASALLNALLDRNPRLDLADLCGLVVGLPGPVTAGHPRDRVLNWGEHSVIQTVRNELEDSDPRWADRHESLPVMVDNDANLSAIAEHRWGAGVGKENVFYVKWSTGLGSGLILDGALRRGAGGAAGEFGHTPVPAEFVDSVGICDVCQQPCFETAIGFKPLLEERNWSYRDVQKIARDPGHSGYQELQRWIDPRAELLGLALVPVVNTINPELVVIDGILDHTMEELFSQHVRRSLERHGAMTAVSSDLAVVGGKFTVSAAARGGLALALDELAPTFLLQKG